MQVSNTLTGMNLDLEFWCGGIVNVGGNLLGRLALCTNQRVEVITATLTVRCCEQTKFGKDVLKSVSYEKDYDIFSALDTSEITHATQRIRVSPGIHYAPFSIEIPPGLPPSFYLHSSMDTKDHIEWTLKAQLLVVFHGDILSRTEHVTVPFLVTQAQPSSRCMMQKVLDPVKLATATEASSTAYCKDSNYVRKIPKSHVLFAAGTGLHHIFSYGNSIVTQSTTDTRIRASFFFPRIAGYVDEPVYMKLNLENCSSKYSIRNIKAKLIRIRTIGIEDGPGYGIRETVLGKDKFEFDVPAQTTRTTVIGLIPSEISKKITPEALKVWKSSRSTKLYLDSLITRGYLMSALRQINSHTSLPSVKTRVGKDAKALTFYANNGGQAALEDPFSKLLAQDFRYDIKISLYKQKNPYKNTGKGKFKKGKKKGSISISQPILLVQPRTHLVGHMHVNRKEKIDARAHGLFSKGSFENGKDSVERMNEMMKFDVKESTSIGIAGKTSTSHQKATKMRGIDEGDSSSDSYNCFPDSESSRGHAVRSPLTEEYESSFGECLETKSLLGRERYVW